MFQTPRLDRNLLDNQETIQSTDPSGIWQNHVSAQRSGMSGFTVCYDPNDPPLTKVETSLLREKLKPVTDHTFNNEQPTLLFSSFFSTQNVDALQMHIRSGVKHWSGFAVGNQSEKDLTLLMKQVYDRLAKNIDEGRAPSKLLMSHIRSEVSRLNAFVVREALPSVVDGVEQHAAYLKQLDQGVSSAALARPTNTSVSGTKVYRTTNDIWGSKVQVPFFRAPQ